MQEHFNVGDCVEVTLLERKSSLYYSDNLNKLNEFKENLIKNIFSTLRKYKDIEQIFIVGSFLTQKQDFNDIDIILISDKNIEKEVDRSLTDKFELKFHIITLPKIKLEELTKYSPLERSLLYFFVSNKDFKLIKDTEVNIDHIKFLLMMPEDLLKITLSSRAYYDSLRRLIAIERFLENKSLNPNEINKELKNLIGENVYADSRQDKNIEKETMDKFKSIISSKLKNVYKELK